MLTIFRHCAKGSVGRLRYTYTITQVANLTGKTTRGEPLKLKKPFPYKQRYITNLEAAWDITVQRVEEENAKLIVVEGPIASGKSAFIKLLAEEFEMNYMSQPTMDDIYLTRSGYDLRQFDDQLPESVRSFDHKNFCTCPNHKLASCFQFSMIHLRILQYIDALAHILNTGQGVILERSVFSDYAFVEAMCSEGHVSKQFRKFYKEYRDIATPLLLHPHVVIYLDVPVTKVQERIKARNLSYEVNSPALTPSFLKKMEDVWKNDYLVQAADHSEVLVYDWSDGGDIDLIVEDLEKLNLDPLSRPEFTQLSDWKTWRRDWRERRMMYTNKKGDIMAMLNLTPRHVPELLVPTDDLLFRSELYRTAPGLEYSPGFNARCGDSLFNILLGRITAKSHKPAFDRNEFVP